MLILKYYFLQFTYQINENTTRDIFATRGLWRDKSRNVKKDKIMSNCGRFYLIEVNVDSF